MALQTTKKISLDFYNNNIITINAKQLDTDSRYLDITCTDHGKKVALDSSEVSAFVRFKKPDGYYVFNDATITEDGTVSVTLTDQILAVPGKGTADILIVDTKTTVENLSDLASVYKLESSILSTMTFYVNIVATAVDHSDIESTYEFDAVMSWVNRMILVENHMEELDDTLNENESIRQANEEARIASEAKREENVKTAISNCETAVDNCETAIENANTAIANAETATSNANSAATTATNAATTANNAATNANNAAGTAIATANTAAENANTAAGAANEAVQKFQNILDGLQTIYFSSTIDDSIGENGDVLMVPIS